MKDNRSVARTLAILELIAKHDEGLTLGQIYRMLDIPKATVYDFLQTLYRADAIYYKDPRLKNYVIGSKMFAIGSVYTKNSNLIEASQFELKDFADRYGRTVFITKRINDKIVYVYKYQPSSSKIVTPQEIGTVSRDFEYGPIGKCYAVFDKTVRNGNIPDFDEIKKNKYVYSSLEDNSHICTLATPVWNFENRIVGVLVASDLAMDGVKRDAIAKDFVEIAKHISRRLGYLGNFDE
ncbi:IclR family transcriptional regulator [Peloplasma aerotolerans]|jgi:IclR family transcriptional regulator, KDG regulon repressor|uniref:Helix-turn-helix domain-containing protein n=1 Tax=Peloplasma aerotolerans TaxID=3044389 RepID=A0AAW6UA29_9MOLU|nr:helix-turn-helix domain-containing protein [Mariniplasma sp. M4Ah]MDI6452499.1 helix-turn-helix domain-containing protein [Mariniplasma sp. M4Ah]MDR4968364.1 helix-turn-helix domain-containing protein [Acholeplasmataceae bacterium]